MSRLTRALSTIRAGRARALEGMLTRKLIKNQTCQEILLPYLNNLSEEAVFGSNKIKEQHEPVNLQNEEDMLRNT